MSTHSGYEFGWTGMKCNECGEMNGFHKTGCRNMHVQLKPNHSEVRSKYHREITPGVWVDVYSVLVAFGVTNPADAHAIKKLLMPGARGTKNGEQDRREAIQSIERAMAREAYKSYLRAKHAEGPRFCTQCRQSRPRIGGREITHNAGRNVRWVCAGCA